MDRYEEAGKRLSDLITKATCPYTAKSEIRKELEAAGFQPLSYRESWKVVPGGKYYVAPFETSIFAFRIGEDGEWKNIRISSSHTDSPALRLKFGPEMKEGNYRKLNVEVYGGGIWNTWMDRPLSMAGAVSLKSANPFVPRIVEIDWKTPVCVIPNRALHLNRTVNDGVAIKNQQDMIPVIGTEMLTELTLKKVIAKTLAVSEEEILDYDLYLYNCEQPAVTGLDRSMLLAPRIDNLSSVGAMLYGLKNGERKSGIDIACFYDHEEIGSRSKNGAAGNLLAVLMERLAAALGKSRKEYLEGLAGAFYMSLDVAHADHPNHREVTDPTTGMAMGEGVTIKAAGKQAYCTDPFSAGVVKNLCEEAGVSCKINYPNSNAVSGSTLGPIISAGLACEGVDIGIPILAMHSACETAAVKDYEALEKLMVRYCSD